MKDFNFFEPYIQQHQGKEKRQNLYYGMAVVCVVAVLAFPVFNLVYAHNMKKDIAQMQTILESPETKEKMARVNEKQSKLEEITAVLPMVQKSELALRKIDVLSDELVQLIVDAIPPDLEFISFNISPEQITINGTARDKSAIAEIEYNLRETKAFKDLFIPSVSLNEGLYNFSIQFALKDVN
ncbi:MAG: hypothetical protein K0R93_1386 [Anaerosolibacter sp.]|uniref:PilN domain-containing protein n=1 Tax=Anaerosolibacter sp. TaxID=1872527 RepID=UPI00260B55BB|nr:PilN domain-containing protein [Anaerosolibacter sp.]MDF2546488.1 hypothetical protein [Anaerosolibacter sp.]